MGVTPFANTPASRRHFMARCGAWALWPALAGCIHPDPPLRLGSIVFSGYEPVFLARELGLLDPSQLRLIELLSNTDTLRALAAGQLEAAQLTLDECMTAVAGGLDLRIVAVLDVSEGADAVIARPDKRRPQDWKGARIAYENSAVGAVMLSGFLRAQGLSISDMEKRPTTMDRTLEAYQKAEADLFVTAEPWLSQIEAAGGVRVFDSRSIPGRIVDVLVVTAAVAQARPDAVRALVQAHFDGLAAWQRNPAEAARHLAPRLQIQPEEVPATLRGLRQPTAADSARMMDPGGEIGRSLVDIETVMRQDGLLKAPLNLARLLEPAFHPTGG